MTVDRTTLVGTQASGSVAVPSVSLPNHEHVMQLSLMPMLVMYCSKRLAGSRLL